MNIHISGCVNKAGNIDASSNITLIEAIELAGGFKQTNNHEPTGIIYIKTKLSKNKSTLRKELNYKNNPSVLNNEILQDNDLVIVQINGEKLLPENAN